MIDTNFADLVQQLAARRDQMQAELDAAMDAHGVICRAHDLLAGTATIVTAKVAEAPPTTVCGATQTKLPNIFRCTLVQGHEGNHSARTPIGSVIATWPRVTLR